MKIVLCTLCLNEIEWLPHLYDQHRGWSGLVRWVFVESADLVYASTNPSMVDRGFSVDGTSDWLNRLQQIDPKVTYIRYGLSSHEDPAQCKCAARTQYLLAADKDEPDFLVVLDADEFYTRQHQNEINSVLESLPTSVTGKRFRHRHPWRPPSIRDHSAFDLEAVGGLWDVPFCRFWRWQPGLRYQQNHNTPETPNGTLLDTGSMLRRQSGSEPECVHMAFASSLKTRQAKHRYYEARGEGRTDHRGGYVQCRAAFETWKPGDMLPCNARIIPYNGPVPECFQTN